MTPQEIVGKIFPPWFETSKQITKLPHKCIALFQAILDIPWVEDGVVPDIPMSVCESCYVLHFL